LFIRVKYETKFVSQVNKRDKNKYNFFISETGFVNNIIILNLLRYQKIIINKLRYNYVELFFEAP